MVANASLGGPAFGGPLVSAVGHHTNHTNIVVTSQALGAD